MKSPGGVGSYHWRFIIEDGGSGMPKTQRRLEAQEDEPPCMYDLYCKESDEDINTIVTPTAPAATHTGPITRARARQLN